MSPIFFNLAGLIFFQTIFWFLIWGRRGNDYWPRLGRLLLLAGMAVEAVLLHYQYVVAGRFCSYCLVIGAIVLTLNLLCGLKQIIRSFVIFAAVTLVLFGLRYSPALGRLSLDDGSIAVVQGQEGKNGELYLFFSTSCVHCEKVIEELKTEDGCTVRFNPVERVESFAFPGASFFPEYRPESNLAFMKSLDLAEVPVMVVKDAGRMEVLRGEEQIRRYLEASCGEPAVEGMSSVSPLSGSLVSPGLESTESCSVNEDCEAPAEGGSAIGGAN